MEFSDLLSFRKIVGLCASCRYWERFEYQQEEKTINDEGYCRCPTGGLKDPQAYDSCSDWKEQQ